MRENPYPKRRDFLKTAAAGAAGAMGLSALRFDRLFAQSTGGWVSGMQVNPAIHNERVICCHDTNMLASMPLGTNFASQNAPVNATLVASNLDEMAKQLAQKATATEAWSSIFRSSKQWANTKVAIKTNAIQGNTGNHPRVAIIKKICDVFVDQLGVPATNIILYDANADASGTYATSASLTDATKIRATVSKYAQSLGGMVPVTIAGSSKSISAPADLVNGVIDILVDICVLKEHCGPGTSYLFGSCSLCMKGHLGTFINAGTDSAPSSTGLHSLDAILSINKHGAILGGNPVRQQLCIVDGLLANNGNSATWNVRSDRIVMGTFAPIVDYLTATKLLLDKTIMAAAPMPALGATNAAIYLPQFLTSFGYAATDALQWVECTPPNWPAITTGSGGSGGAGGSGDGGTTAAGGGGGGGGTTAAGGDSGGGTSAAGGDSATSGAGGGSGGTTDAAGTTGTTGTGGAASGGAGTTAATSAASTSGGSATTGGTNAGTGTGSNAAGGNSGTAGTTVSGGNSGTGCSVAEVRGKAARWSAVLAFGAVVAEKLRRLVSGGDRTA
jgi:hypothetical protein